MASTTQSDVLEQTLPTDYVEKLILNRFLVDSSILSSIDRNMTDGVITNQVVSELYHIADHYYRKYGRVPDQGTFNLLVDRFCQKFERPVDQYRSSVDEIYNMVVPNDPNVVKENMLALIKQNTFVLKMTQVTTKLAKDKMGLEKVNEQMKILEDVLEMTFDDDVGMDYLASLDDHFATLRRADSHISTGYPSLDYVMNGGVPNIDGQRWLGCLMGQANIGKSLWLGSLAYQALRADRKVLIISCEMSQHMYARRMDALISGENIDLMHTTMVHPEEAIRKFFAEHPRSRLFIKEFAANTASAADIARVIEQYDRQDLHPDFIYVDYLNLLRPLHKEKDELLPFMIKRICEELRNLSLTHNVKIWTATQVNGEGIDNSEMNIGMTSGSKGIGMTVDAMFGIWRAKDDRDANLTHLQVIKNRDGHVGETLLFTQDRDTLLIKESGTAGFSDGEAPKFNIGPGGVDTGIGSDAFDDFSNM